MTDNNYGAKEAELLKKIDLDRLDRSIIDWYKNGETISGLDPLEWFRLNNIPIPKHWEMIPDQLITGIQLGVPSQDLIQDLRSKVRKEIRESMSYGDRKPITILTVNSPEDIPSGYLVADLIPRNGVTGFISSSNVGKTFAAIDIGLSLTHGRNHPAFGQLTTTKVLYIAGEGHGGFRRRINAWYEQNKYDKASTMDYVLSCLDLRNRATVNELKDIVEQNGYGLVIFDTFRKLSGDTDENATNQTQVIYNNIDEIRGEASALVLHHNNKAGKYNGSAVHRNTVDVMAHLKQGPNQTFSISTEGADGKVRDGKGRTWSGFQIVDIPVNCVTTGVIVVNDTLPTASGLIVTPDQRALIRRAVDESNGMDKDELATLLETTLDIKPFNRSHASNFKRDLGNKAKEFGLVEFGRPVKYFTQVPTPENDEWV